MKKKGQGISVNVIIIAAIALLVLVVLVAFFMGYFDKFMRGSSGTDYCVNQLKGECSGVGINDKPEQCPEGTNKVDECNKGEGYCCKVLLPT